jgi:hypothetical protein
MKKAFFLIFTCILTFAKLFSQVDDSTSVSIISYWNKGDHYTYDCSLRKYQVNAQDTSRELEMNYQLDMIVIDSSATAYVFDAKYSNFNIKTELDIIREIMKASQDITLKVKISDVGAIEDLNNWKEVQQYIIKPINTLKSKYKDNPMVEKSVEAMSGMYSSKEAIMASSMQDLQILQYFHGLVYKRDTIIEAIQQRKSNFSDALLDVKVSIWFDSLLVKDAVAKMIKYEEFDKDQITNEVAKYFKSVGIKLTEEEFDKFKVNLSISTVNYIDLNTGWTIYSTEYKETVTDNVIAIEEREIIMR